MVLIMEFDELFKGGPVFAKECGAFAPGTDAVVLSDFASPEYAKNICDIGCGCGVLAIIAAMRSEKGRVTAIDIQPQAIEQAAANIKANSLDGRIQLICGDIRQYKALFEAGSFDYIVTNPPYFPKGSGKASLSQEIARQEVCCTLYDITAAASYMLKYGGYCAMVHRADRCVEVICALSESGLEPKVIRFVQYKPSSPPSLILIKSKKGGKKGVTVMPPLILSNEDGTKSDEAVRIWERRYKNN